MTPLMTHFWFIDGQVITYNDRMAMSKPLDLGFNFTAPALMLDTLKVSYQAGDIEFRESIGKKGERGVKIRIGGGDQKNDFNSFDPEDTRPIFEMPKANYNAPVFGESLGKAQLSIETCLLAISSDQLQPERTGITIIPEDKALALYAFNNTSMARCTLNLGDSDFKGRVTIPADFWSIFLNLTKGMVVKESKKSVLVSIGKKEIIAKVGDVRLLAKVLPVDQPTDLLAIFAKHYTPALKKQLVPLTEDIGEAMDRAVEISRNDADCFTEVSVTKNVLRLETNAQDGFANDIIEFPHPDVAPVQVKLAQLSKGRKLFERMAVSKDVVVATKGERVFMISAKG